MGIDTKIVLGIAFIALFVGPIVSYYIARIHIKAEVLSKNRQNWINDLRNQLSEFISLISVLSTEHASVLMDDNSFIQFHQKTLLVKSKIELLINPKEDDHSQLSENIYQAYREMLKPEKDIDRKKLGQFEGIIVRLSQEVLKREWERVKKID